MTKRKYKIISALTLLLLLVVELIGGLVGTVSGLLLMVVTSYLAFTFARDGNIKSFMVVLGVFTLAVYVFSKPNLHYGLKQYDHEQQKHVGNPHNHTIWELDHVH